MQTFLQYCSILFLKGESFMLLSARQANLNIMFGGEKRLVPKTNKKVAQTKIGYSFKKIALLLKKHKRPATINKNEDKSGFQSRRACFFEEKVFAKKNAKPKLIIQSDKSLKGNFSSTNNTKTNTGYSAASI